MKETKLETIEHLLSIGFCQRKFYKPTVWRYATRLMSELTKQGLCRPYDYGRGKGKFTSAFKREEILQHMEVTQEIIRIVLGYERYYKKLETNKFYKGEYNNVKIKETAN